MRWSSNHWPYQPGLGGIFFHTKENHWDGVSYKIRFWVPLGSEAYKELFWKRLWEQGTNFFFFKCNVLERVHIHMIQNSKNIGRFRGKGLHTSIPCLPGSHTPSTSTWAAILFLYASPRKCKYLFSFLPLVLCKMCLLYTLVYLLFHHLITDVLELFPVGEPSHSFSQLPGIPLYS